MPMVLEKRGAGGVRKWPSAGRVAGDWAKMRVLQWFHGVRPHQVLVDCELVGSQVDFCGFLSYCRGESKTGML